MAAYENDVDFRVASGDRVGWTFEGSTGIISFQYVEEHKTYFRKVKDVGFPVFQETYTFDNIHLPSIFSAAVKIDPILHSSIYQSDISLGHKEIRMTGDALVCQWTY
ncbi:hypothetical protein CAPTEDRAFT_211564 [Capitella teleta]|uniref:Uncharacterized protein n=1 Tax=Capitella teleta TaxID=283909 RepID=R7T3Q5_CAPTE|nr:hypothetical protein CAPTEDRAFT_211564 [Capitella teleta]|eukprot:ELT87437.1 hypothetical protein CAPTEDRAFT_211564 [Capitella teleta]